MGSDPSSFYLFKIWLVNAIGLARDALHIHFGLTALLLVVLLFRQPLRSPWPWLTAVALAILGEVLDRRDQLAVSQPWNRPEAIKDVLNTILWPTLLMLLARFTGVLRR